MEKSNVIENNNRIDWAEKGFFVLFTLYAILTSCGFTFGTVAISMVMWPSFLLGGCLIGYRVFHYKNYIATPLFALTIAMLFSIALTTVLNYHYSLKTNVVFCLYWALYFLVLYTTDRDTTVEKIKKDFYFVAWVFAVMVSLLVLASFAVFLVGYSREIRVEDDFTYYIGFAIGRLWGVFVNLNRGAVSAAIAAFLLLYFCKRKKTLRFRIPAGIMIFFNLLFIALSDSRSGAICFALLLGALTVLVLSRRFQGQGIAKRLLALLLAAVVMVSGYLLPRGMKVLYNQTAKAIYKIELSINRKSGKHKKIKKPESVERGYDLSDDISNRRFDVWASGIEIYFDSPKNITIGTSFGGMVGYAEEHLPETYILSNDFDTIGTMDNDFFNLLVAQGTLGIVLMMALAIGISVLFIQHVKQVKKEDTPELFVMLSVLLALVGSSMFTSLIFYYFSQNSVLFWAFLGLSVRLLISEKGEKADDA